ncbi:MAG: hypothetical protein KC933_15385, partial [Myxococcales bacterium]|nr:hypothetical protein [Myxococcales bacterium]
MAQADAFLRARSLQELGELARDFGLNAALRAPMQRVLGEAPIPGRMTREIAQLAAALGTDDVAALLMDGEALLAAPAKRGVKQKLFEHARTYLYQAAQAEDGGATPPAPPPSQPTRASAPSPPSRADGPPRDEAALRAWAAAEGVGPLLEQTAFRTLSDGQPELFRGWTPPEVARATLADVLCDRDLLEGGDAVVRRQLARVQEATWAFLQAAAKDATRAVEEEAALPWLSGAVPEGQARQALARALLAARRGVRSAVSPRSTERRRPWSVVVEAGELPTATYQEEAESRLAFPVKVTVRVRDDQGLELRSTHSGTDVDPYVLSALDALLARVYDPEDQSLGPLLDAFAHPPWLRGLMALEAAVADPEAAAREGALGWWLGFEPTLGVRPAHLKLKRDGGLARPKPV